MIATALHMAVTKIRKKYMSEVSFFNPRNGNEIEFLGMLYVDKHDQVRLLMEEDILLNNSCICELSETEITCLRQLMVIQRQIHRHKVIYDDIWIVAHEESPRNYTLFVEKPKFHKRDLQRRKARHVHKSTV